MRSQSKLLQSHFSKTPTFPTWNENVHWENVFWIIVFPLFGLVAAVFTPLQTKTAIWTVVYHFTTGLGITAGLYFATVNVSWSHSDVVLGYHRLWAHRSYTASLPLKIWLAAVGGGAMEHSIINWSRDHRAHHRYTDTDKDPYSVRTGLLYAHIGWLVFRQDPERQGRADISDLINDPIVIWQHNHYTEIAILMAYILPCCIGGIWGDWWGGFVYAGIIRAFLVQQSTFCVNSVAHWLGDQTFDDRNSPRDHAFTALITLGEGYHNFHHEFPSDYRNAIALYQFDPTKWAIWLWKQLGLAHNLKMFCQNEIEKGRLQQQQKKLDLRHAELQLTMLEQLPVMEWDDYQKDVAKGRSWLAIAGGGARCQWICRGPPWWKGSD